MSTALDFLGMLAGPEHSEEWTLAPDGSFLDNNPDREDARLTASLHFLNRAYPGYGVTITFALIDSVYDEDAEGRLRATYPYYWESVREFHTVDEDGGYVDQIEDTAAYPDLSVVNYVTIGEATDAIIAAAEREVDTDGRALHIDWYPLAITAA